MSTPVEQIVTLMAEMTFAEKLALNERLAISLRKEGGAAAPGKKRGRKPKDSAEDSAEDKPKRKAAPGVLAWTAFVKKMKDEQPELFEGLTKEADKLSVIKEWRKEDAEHEEAYKSFAAQFVAQHAATAAEATEEAEEAEEAAEEAPAPISAAQKLAQLKAKQAATNAAKTATAAAKKPVKAAPPTAPMVLKKNQAAIGGGGSVAAAAPVTAALPKKQPKAAPAPKKQEPKMEVIEIAGETYYKTESNGLYATVDGEDGVLGAWVGIFQEDNEDEPILYTDSAE
jgi:hypothetical protein